MVFCGAQGGAEEDGPSEEGARVRQFHEDGVHHGS